MRLPQILIIPLLLLLTGGCSGEAVDDLNGLDPEPQDCAAAEATGSWQLQYSGASSPGEIVSVLQDGAGLQVDFVDRSAPKNECGAPGEETQQTVTTAGSFDAPGCMLELTYSASWCHSGEQQHERLQLTLVVDGDVAEGRAVSAVGWTSDETVTEQQVSAARVD